MAAAAILAVLALMIAAVVAVGAALGLGPWHSSQARLLGDATWPAGARRAPRFRLFDQQGRAVTPASERGHTIVLTFLYSHCRELCPTIGAELAQVQRSLPAADQPELVIVSVDPAGDTPASVRAFAANEGWNGHWQWLLGTQAELAPVWRAYGIEVKPGAAGVAHSGAVYLIDRNGDERSGYVAPFLVQDITADIRTLSAAPSSPRRISLAAATTVGLVAIGVLILLAPWASGARARAIRLARLQRRRIAAVAAVIVLVGLGAAFLLRPSNSAPPVAGALIPTAARQPAISLVGGTVLVPPPVVLSAEHGRVVYLNFWASWCIPCRQEAPAIRAFAQSLNPQRATFVGINVSDKRSNALSFIRQYRLTYPILADTGGAIRRRYQLLGLPTTVAIDQRGRIAVQLLGPQTTPALEATLRRLLRRPS